MPEVSAAPTVVHSTFVIERTLPVSPERVFAAFADQAQKSAWYANSRTHDVVEYTMNFRKGGADHGRFRFREGTPFPGVVFSNDTTYQDIVPNRRIVMAYTMAFDGRCFSASLATVELVPTDEGTRLFFTEQGAFFENSDGPEKRKHGWAHLLDELATYLAT